MTTLLEWKERAKLFYAKYDIYVKPVAKFLLALTAFMAIGNNIGYMEQISTFPVALILALLCAILPVGATVFFGAVLILLDMYALSLEVFLAALILFLVITLLYLRFAPGTAYMLVLTPICFVFHVPYIMPVAEGLLYEPGSILSVICGTFLYYFLNGIRENETVLSAASEDSSAVSRISSIVKQVSSNREMLLVLLVFVLVMVLVYIIRRMAVNHSWTIAIVTGYMVEFIILFGGFLIMGYSSRLIFVTIGNAVSVLAAFLLKFLFFNMDYKRTERVQFEDDDYYYYVKAVPKINLQVSDKQVKKFNSKNGNKNGNKKQPPKHGGGRGSSAERAINKKEIAEELDIDEDILDL